MNMYTHLVNILSPYSFSGLRIYINSGFQSINSLKYAILSKFGHQTQIQSVLFELDSNEIAGNAVVIRDDVPDINESFTKLLYRNSEIEQWMEILPDHVIGSSPIVDFLTLLKEVRNRTIRDVIISSIANREYQACFIINSEYFKKYNWYVREIALLKCAWMLSGVKTKHRYLVDALNQMNKLYKGPERMKLPGGLIFTHSGHNLFNIYKDIMRSGKPISFTLTKNTELIFNDVWKIYINKKNLSNISSYEIQIGYPEKIKQGEFDRITMSIPLIKVNGIILLMNHRSRYNHYQHSSLQIISHFTNIKRKFI